MWIISSCLWIEITFKCSICGKDFLSEEINEHVQEEINEQILKDLSKWTLKN